MRAHNGSAPLTTVKCWITFQELQEREYYNAKVLARN